MKLVAIGDIHGCYETMQALISKVKAQYPNEELQFIFLGDYVDRGPNSRAVIQYLIDHPEHIALMGNHEDMMVDALGDGGGIENETYWFNNGGITTMDSYGWRVPKEHMEFLQGLQVIYNYGKWVFVHAGIDPTIKELENQNLIGCLWSRKWNDVPIYEGGWKVVHGHTPITWGMPDILFDQFNLDTACVFGYNLTAMVIDPTTDEYEFVMEAVLQRTTLLEFDERIELVRRKANDETLRPIVRRREQYVLDRLLTRRQLWIEQDGKCAVCGKNTYLHPYFGMPQDRLATFEHITPKSHGGSDDAENGKITCHECNNKRGTEPFGEFVDKVKRHGLAALKSNSQKKRERLDTKRSINTHNLGWALSVLWNERGHHGRKYVT